LLREAMEDLVQMVWWQFKCLGKPGKCAVAKLASPSSVLHVPKIGDADAGSPGEYGLLDAEFVPACGDGVRKCLPV
jgi:hypothetical protein